MCAMCGGTCVCVCVCGQDVDTRAIIVVRNGRIVAERYGPDFQPHTRLASWSNAKSVISTLIGIRIAQGHLRLDQTRLFPEWSNAADPRSNITLANLLHMSSGLEFDEKYDRHSDARDMLFLRPSMSDFAVNKPLIHAPGTKWYRSCLCACRACRAVSCAVCACPEHS